MKKEFFDIRDGKIYPNLKEKLDFNESSENEFIGDYWRVWREGEKYFLEHDIGHFASSFVTTEIEKNEYEELKSGYLKVDDILYKQSQERAEKLKQGKPASRTLLFFGWLFSVLGGLIGLGIAWSICFMKEKTPEGEFFTYDEKSRGIAKSMFVLACVMTGLVFIFGFSNILSR
jgi:hypothetical protein